MINNLLKSTKHQLKSLHTDNKKGFLIGTLVGILLATSPYLFYLYESVPEKLVWSTFLFNYHSNFYQNANVAMWILTGKVIPLMFLFLWFFTCRHWWYHCILVPITMYTYQIVTFFNDEYDYLDEFQLMYMVPVMALIIPSIYLIRARIFNKLNDADKSFEELEQEFMIKPTSVWGRVKQYF